MTSLLDLLTSMTLNDLDPPKRFLVNFSRFFNAAHISTLNCDEMAEDRPRQLLGSRRPAQVGVKDRYPHSGYFTAIILCSVKRLQIGTDMLLIMTSNIDKLFTDVNVDDLE